MKNTPAYPHMVNWNGDGPLRPDHHLGLTKREAYAMAAMQGLLAGNATYFKSTENRQALAQDAAAHADALIAALEQNK